MRQSCQPRGARLRRSRAALAGQALRRRRHGPLLGGLDGQKRRWAFEGRVNGLWFHGEEDSDVWPLCGRCF